MNNFIQTIKTSVRSRADSIQIEANLMLNTLNFCDIFQSSTIPAIIAEIKFASPSRGRIYQGNLDPVTIASDYLSHGASALSILTEPEYFQGNIESIRAVRQAYPETHILLKDFVLSKAQIAQGLLYGANAVLLIVAFLNPKLLKSLYDYTLSLGLTPLIEVHDLAELEIALALKPKLIGINHRNLSTLTIDLDISDTLIKSIPNDVFVIAESGIETKADLNTMVSRGVDGCLIGSCFMKETYPGHALQQLLEDNDEN
ncbi:MAG: indole-3-glycerol phosphate synthase [Legionella sp.]|nr:MAG: indole-3-glycerol phosphate synthase [Legionella sp.]